MILKDQDRGRSFDVSIGSPVIIRLNENPVTGYRWMIDRKDGLELESDAFEKGSDAIGSAGVHVFQFRASKAGMNKVQMNNLREWEGDSSVIDRFNVTISVK